MENKNIIVLKHHPMNVFFSNPFYRNQFAEGENPEDYVILDVTSRNKDKEFIKYLSPFFMGPCQASDGLEFKIFENMWQFGKVFEGDAVFRKLISTKKSEDIPFVSSDKDGNPTEEWFENRKIGAGTTLAHRRPYVGKPLYHYYVNTDGNTERLGYVESRKKVYIPEYAKLIHDTPSFRKLKEIVDSGRKLALVDFDGYNYYNPKYMSALYEKNKAKYSDMRATLEEYLNIRTMKDVINYPELLAGHAFVIKMLLQGDISVVYGKVVDHVGVLD